MRKKRNSGKGWRDEIMRNVINMGKEGEVECKRKNEKRRIGGICIEINRRSSKIIRKKKMRKNDGWMKIRRRRIDIEIKVELKSNRCIEKGWYGNDSIDEWNGIELIDKGSWERGGNSIGRREWKMGGEIDGRKIRLRKWRKRKMVIRWNKENKKEYKKKDCRKRKENEELGNINECKN